MGNRDHENLTVWRIQFFGGGFVEVFGVRDNCCVECNTFVLLLGLFDFLLDDNFNGRKVIRDLNFLIFLVDDSDGFGDLLDRDQFANGSVNDGLKDVRLDVLSNLEANLSFENSIDLRLVDELITDSLEVHKEVLGDIDLVLLLVISVWLEPLP